MTDVGFYAGSTYCKTCEKQRKKDNRVANLEAYKRRERQSKRAQYASVKGEIFVLLGGQCANCESPNRLEIDHVYADGHIARVDIKNGKHWTGNVLGYYRDILAQIQAGSKDFQLLCRPCHEWKVSSDLHVNAKPLEPLAQWQSS